MNAPTNAACLYSHVCSYQVLVFLNAEKHRPFISATPALYVGFSEKQLQVASNLRGAGPPGITASGSRVALFDAREAFSKRFSDECSWISNNRLEERRVECL